LDEVGRRVVECLQVRRENSRDVECLAERHAGRVASVEIDDRDVADVYAITWVLFPRILDRVRTVRRGATARGAPDLR
jgi:hypothetical protein